MARGDSIIRVSIIGDAKDLNKTLAGVDTKIGNIGKIGAGVIGGFVALGAIDKAFDFLGGALDKADAFHDALDTLSGTISPEFAQRINDIAFDFTDIGLSADEVGVIAGNFANLATAAGVSQPLIATLTPDLLKIAASVAATTGKTLDEVVTDIGKAAQGSQKPVSEYGVLIDKSLNPDAQILSIFDQLKAKYPDVITATGDLAGKQDTLNAKWDNFTIKVGEALEGPLSGVLDFFITMIDRDIPNMMDMLGDLGDSFVGFGRTVLGPLGNVRDALEGLSDLIGDIGFNLTHIGQDVPSESSVTKAARSFQERNGLQSIQGRP